MGTRNDKLAALNPEETRRWSLRIKYAYVVLALISVLCAAIAVQISLKAIRGNNQKFCDLTTSFESPAPVRPTDPAHDTLGERSWIVYGKIVKFNHKIGCD